MTTLASHVGWTGPHVAPFIAHYLKNWRPYRPHWNYEDGCIYKGVLDLHDVTGDRSLWDFAYRAISERISPDGTITGYDPNEFNIDNVNAGKALFTLLERTGENRFRLAIERQAEQLARHPRTKSGSYWHKKIYPNQVWLDGLYMAQPFQLALAKFTRRDDLIADTVHQFANVRDVMRVEGGLYRHGWDESREQAWADQRTGLSPHVWGRAMGWFMMALVDCLELDPNATLKDIFADTSRALIAVQRPSGLWQQVIDAPDREGNYEEASASLMIAYALMKGARLGLLDRAHHRAGRRAFEACVTRFVTDTALNGICAVAGLGGNPYRDGSYRYYLSEPIVANDPKGVGAFMMALAEATRTRETA